MNRIGVPPRRPVLVVDDDPDFLRLIVRRMESCGYEPVTAENGERGWEILDSRDAPDLAVIDWLMPGVDGVEICKRLRQRESPAYVYVILLSSRERQTDVVAGLDAGADDYVTKPLQWDELRCRLRTGERVLELKSSLDAKVEELRRTLMQVRELEGLIPICSHCKRIRDPENQWRRLESYIEKHSDVSFTHSLCASCLKEHYPTYATD